MVNFKRSLSLLLLTVLLIGCFCGCKKVPSVSTEGTTGGSDATTAPQIEEKDYAASIKLNMNSPTEKTEATVKQFIDGDTTHFTVPTSVMPNGVLKARYLAINTPESTGKIEEWGKAAAAFTKEKLSAATSIILESEVAFWDPDSTGDRYLCWVWYKTAEDEEYRNLNIEILQNGLAIANNSANNQYGTTCVAALDQAKALKLHVFSGQKDPGFYYGEAIELTLKELRTNIESYNGQKVAFDGVITMNNNNGVYVETYDAESNLYYGMYVYYGFNLSGAGMDILKVGHEVRIVGSVQYYEAGGTWQVSDVSYRQMKPDDPNNLQKLSEGNKPAYVPTDPATFANGKVTIETEEGTMEKPYAAMAMSTSVEMKDLTVVDVYTTSNEDSSSKGAMTLTCRAADGTLVDVRTIVLKDADGKLITADAYMGKTIDVKGIVDYFSGSYQIKVFSADHINVHE